MYFQKWRIYKRFLFSTQEWENADTNFNLFKTYNQWIFIRPCIDMDYIPTSSCFCLTFNFLISKISLTLSVLKY